MGRQAEGPGGPPWGSRGRRSGWQAALLAAAILSSSFRLSQAQEVTVSVTVEPSKPLVGQDVTLTPVGNPTFTLCNWFRGGDAEANRIFTYYPTPPVQQNGPGFTGRETGGPGCSLYIRSLMLNYTGDYVVSKSMIEKPERGRVSLEVSERVSNVSITSRPNKAIENDVIVLDCRSAGSGVNYTWSKGDQILESGGHIILVNNSLKFSSVRRNDTGSYTCTGRNSFSNSSATYQLDVFYGPDEPVISPPGHDYGEGSLLNLSCHADSHPPAQYTWSFNGTELPETDPQLLIPSLSFSQSGNYACNASNNETSHSKSTSWEIRVLEKLFPPILWPTDPSVKEHANVTLNCNTSESSRVDVFWFKDGNPIPAKSLLSERNRTFHIPDISRDDEGTYTCQAWNPANSAISNPSRIALDSPAPEPPGGLSPGAIVGIVIGCLVGAAIIVAVVYFALKSTTMGPGRH